MPRPARRSPAPTKPLVKTPVRIGFIDTVAAVGRLRQHHEGAEDSDIHRMPADDELYGALLYLETHAGALRNIDARRDSAIERVRLWEYLREQADVRQSRAIEDARTAGVEWAELAPALAVNASSAAYNKAMRLRAAALVNPADPSLPVRRTPEAVMLAERQVASKAAADRRAEELAARRHDLLAPVARRLLEHRAELDDDDDVEFWLDQVEAVLPHCETPTQFVSLGIYIKAVVRELLKAGPVVQSARRLSEGAQAAVDAAAAIVAEA
ncbi:hypothetical protein [Streptomyces canus]|uniref:hypothetical protein n=1 Tax=Streptomyces canus TaxID=58343 RepID=UPI00216B3600|nr:hypothetical protein [Streptomyces canus]